MQYKHLKDFIPLLALAGIFLVPSCNKEWNDHYDAEAFDLPDETVAAYIKEQPELSTFYTMLGIAGYTDLLNASQSFTVWAPDNDALAGFDLSDTALVKKTVQNHIARGRHTTSGVITSSIRMLNRKYISFARKGSEFSFGNNSILKPNQPGKNGLVHVIDGFTPYVPNLWEYLNEKEGIDSLRSYIYGQSKKIFDAASSTELGVNEEGKVIYDSVFVMSNSVLEKLGAIDNEDSIYTAIMPDNSAWSQAYSKIKKYFNFPADGGAAIRQDAMTRFTIVQDMIYRGRVSEAEKLDSLTSTSGNVFYNPSELFKGLDYSQLSNGLAYVTSQMPFTDTTSWFRKIKVEAEAPSGRTNSGSNIFARTSYGTGFNASDNQYILVDPTSASANVEFSIPNTLSAKYNIYCVFVPAKIVDANNLTPTKARFQLTYIRRSSGSTFIKRVTPTNNITDPNAISPMFVDQFDFEFANVVDDDYDRIAVKLQVINDVTTQEEQTGQFSRTMRIDCIILEPVLE